MNRPATESIPCIAKMEGIESADMTPEEAFVFSRVNGHSSLGEIAKILGYDADKVWGILKRFVESGFIEFQTVQKPSARKASKSGKKSILDELDEEESDPSLNKVPRSVRNDIRVAYDALSKKNHYEVLGLSPKATAVEIKKSYYDKVKTYHPDRFFGQEIGHYREKLELIFAKVSQAFDDLGDPIKRKGYDRSLEKKETKKSDGKFAVPEPVKLTTRTLIEQLALARRYYDLGKNEELSGKDLAAANFFQMAYQYDPKNSTYERAAQRSAPHLERKRSEDLFNKGVEAYHRGDRATAIAFLEETLELNPRKKECYRELARLHLNNKASLHRAKELGLRALEFYAQDAEVHVTMGLIYKGLGEKNLAKKEFKVALKLDNDNTSAEEELAELERK